MYLSNRWRSPVTFLVICLWLFTASAPALLAQSSAPDAPVLLAPDDGAQTTGVTHPPLGIPTLVWAVAESATKYQVQISVSSGFAATVVDTTTENTRYTPILTLGDGIFYWRVRSATGNTWGDYSDPFSFQVDWGDNGAFFPELLTPEEGAERSAFGHNDFSWAALPGTAFYRFQIATSPDFATVAYSADTAMTHHTPSQRLGNNTYYWRVMPLDNKGNVGVASPIRTFNFNWSNAPELLVPANNAEEPFVPRFSWTAVEGAKEYRLEISTQDNFASAEQIVTRNTDYTPVDALSNDQDYFWRVQAVDGQGTASLWSETRRFRTRWYFKPELLSPANNSIRLAYPFFAWKPVPGAEKYQIQIANNNVFENPKVVDTIIFNAASYTQPQWSEAFLDSAYYWRVRAVDAEGNNSPWSDTWAFQFSNITAPNLVYPPPYHTPDAANTPVYSERTFGAPLFIWDTAHSVTFDPAFQPQTPDFYRLEVDDDPSFQSPNFTIDTAGIAAAPTLDHPFDGLQEGALYHWRVRAYLGGGQIPQDDVQVTWSSRYASAAAPSQRAASAEPTHPADGFEAVEVPPVLSWLPVTGAAHYRVQVARDADFTDVVDEALATHGNYVPWQGREAAMPYGSYWWRLRGEDSASTPVGDWSAPRRFNLSLDLAIGNHYDFKAPTNLAADTSGRALVARSPVEGLGMYELKDLFTIVDRRVEKSYNQHWVIAFTTGATVADTVRYAVYLDTDHVAGSGGANDPLGNNAITTDPYHRPEYVIYVDLVGGVGISAQFFTWNDGSWGISQLTSMGGSVEFDPALQSVQFFVPYTALGSANTDWVGSLALAVYSLEANTIQDAVPEQGTTLADPVFVSNMLQPLYPFDTPFSNPITHYDMPTLRWRMPAFGTDGYQVQVARDSLFTQIVETWESFETKEGQFFTLIPTAFQSKIVYANNESYYWRVRSRHEKYRPGSSAYDYGPWSPAMRFKLDSLRVGNPQLSTGVDVFMTPTFTWERMEGASGYTLQVDDDANFSNSLINEKTDANSYTPVEPSAPSSLQSGIQYYWRVAMRRSSSVAGQWTETMTFTKSSLWPEPVAPLDGAILDRQPTLRWNAVLTPSLQPRLAAPAYRVQIANNPAFNLPKINVTTQSTSFTPGKAQNLADGVWYWRVAFVDANSKIGPYSPAQSFTKEYALPQLLWPTQSSVLSDAPTFVWAATNGAASYKLQYADNSNYNGVTTVTTDLTEYTPTKLMKTKSYFWRVQMYDVDKNPGSLIEGQFTVAYLLYLPAIQAGQSQQ